MQDMAKMGLQIINLTIQNFVDNNKVIENLGVDNIAQISKNASIARAQAERDVQIAVRFLQKNSSIFLLMALQTLKLIVLQRH